MSETLIDDRAAPGPDDGVPATTGPDGLGGAGPLDADAPEAPPAGLGRLAAAWQRFVGMPVEGWITLFVLVSCVAFTFYQLNWGLGPHPSWGNVLANNTPAGGDMGAHVWGPAFLRDHLLPQGRLSGWTPDWYDGFPAYTFYMVLPSLMIALLSYVIPYGIAFKLIVISGVLTLPIAAWAFGRLTRLPFPAPAALAVGATAYLFDRSFSIYGGNIASTLAGEFSFSISLTFALLFLGVFARGLETGKYRAWAAALFALTALCHIIPVFFAVAGAIVLLALQLDWSRVRWWTWLGLGLVSCSAAAVIALASISNGFVEPMVSYWQSSPTDRLFQLSTLAIAFVVFCILVVVAAVVLGLSQRPRPWGHLKYLLTVLPVGAAISAFWTGPFYLNSKYMTDMGWEKLTTYSDALFSRSHLADQLSDRPGIQYLLVLAAVGVLMAFAYRRRGEVFWVVMAVVSAIGFLYVPQSRLWNARLLPFYYLAVYLVGAVGLAELGRTVARIIAADVNRPPRLALWATALAVLGGWLLVLALPLHSLPGGVLDANGVTYRWGPLTTRDSSFITSWANWNFSGYEGKPYYPEYYGIVRTMAQVGRQHGCGRAMWEYSSDLNNYGTPMALMLLPFWTDECIGSMEGLYFEASATTPYHFLNQSELSTSPSDAMRDLAYRTTAINQQDFDLGVAHLQMLGVRYYMASTPETKSFAANNQALHQIAASGPWVVYEVADSSLVVPLRYQPVVVNGASAGGKTWLTDTENWYLDPQQWSVLLAASGPSDWHRVDPGGSTGKIAVGSTSVAHIAATTDTISFDVSKTGVPVEVKASYFPNWRVSGAKGPYRVSPNLMVVIPTSHHVSLSYGYTNVDYGSYLLTFLGLVGLVLLWRAKPVEVGPIAPMWRGEDGEEGPPSDDPRDPEWWIDPDDPFEAEHPVHGPPSPADRSAVRSAAPGPPAASGPPAAPAAPAPAGPDHRVPVAEIDPAAIILAAAHPTGSDTTDPTEATDGPADDGRTDPEAGAGDAAAT